MRKSACNSQSVNLSGEWNECLIDFGFEICDSSQVVFITSSKLTRKLFLFPTVLVIYFYNEMTQNASYGDVMIVAFAHFVAASPSHS